MPQQFEQALSIKLKYAPNANHHWTLFQKNTPKEDGHELSFKFIATADTKEEAIEQMKVAQQVLQTACDKAGIYFAEHNGFNRSCGQYVIPKIYVDMDEEKYPIQIDFQGIDNHTPVPSNARPLAEAALKKLANTLSIADQEVLKGIILSQPNLKDTIIEAVREVGAAISKSCAVM